MHMVCTRLDAVVVCPLPGVSLNYCDVAKICVPSVRVFSHTPHKFLPESDNVVTRGLSVYRHQVERTFSLEILGVFNGHRERM
jgi:hypothetical protein